MGRIDLQTIPEHVRNLVTGHLQDTHLLPGSPRALRIIVSRYGIASGEQQSVEQRQGEYPSKKNRKWRSAGWG